MNQIDEMLAMGARHQREGRLPQAERLFRQVLQEQPQHPEALRLLGVLLVQRGAQDQGQALLEAAATLSPDDPAAVLGLGLAHCQRGALDEAEVCFRRALDLDPHSAEAHNNLADILVARGETAAARELLERALELDPDYHQAHFNLGNLLAVEGQARAAMDHYLRAEQLAPEDWQTKCNMALLLRQMGVLEAAERTLRRARLLEPTSPVLALNLASVLLDTGKFEEAEKLCREACVLLPRLSTAHNNLGLALLGLGRQAEAVMALLKALALDPEDARARANLGTALLLEGKAEKALECFDRALAAQPQMARAELDRARALLLLGRHEEGWPGLGARRRLAGVDPTEEPPLPRWEGEDPAQRTLLVWGDGGLSEALLLVRLLPGLRRLGARVVLECPPVVQRLFRSSDLADAYTPPGQVPETADLQVSLDALPQRLGLGREAIPAPPYLSAPDELSARWGQRLAGEQGLTIGFLWREEASGDPHQAIPLVDLARLWELQGTRWLSLQYQVSGEEAALLSADPRVRDLARDLEDLADALACLRSLQLLITPDTALAHLAGAAGIPAWVLLPTAPGWCWGLRGDASPWYPHPRLFRRPRYGPWDAVLESVRAALQERLAQRAT
jgi:Flp pilus assembly protein TadD